MGKNLHQPYPLRMPPELRAELDEKAKENDRSLHAEIIRRLENSLELEAESEREAVNGSTEEDLMNAAMHTLQTQRRALEETLASMQYQMASLQKKIALAEADRRSAEQLKNKDR